MTGENTTDGSGNNTSNFANDTTLREIMCTIPAFDGKNKPLKDYIRILRNAIEYVPEEKQKSLALLVLNTLDGSARDSTFGMKFDTVEDLIKHLKKRFATGKTYGYFVNKINELRMKEGQTVSDFRDKLNILLGCAENALKEEKGTAYQPAMMQPTKDQAMDVFIRGLPSEMSREVDGHKPTTLAEAYEEALRLEGRIRAKVIPDLRGRHSSRYVHYSDSEEEENDYRRRPSRNYRDDERYSRRRERYSPGPRGDEYFRRRFERINLVERRSIERDEDRRRPQGRYNDRDDYRRTSSSREYDYSPPRRSRYDRWDRRESRDRDYDRSYSRGRPYDYSRERNYNRDYSYDRSSSRNYNRGYDRSYDRGPNRGYERNQDRRLYEPNYGRNPERRSHGTEGDRGYSRDYGRTNDGSQERKYDRTNENRQREPSYDRNQHLNWPMARRPQEATSQKPNSWPLEKPQGPMNPQNPSTPNNGTNQYQKSQVMTVRTTTPELLSAKGLKQSVEKTTLRP